MKKRIYYGWWILASSIVIVYLAGTILFGFPVYYPFLIAGFGWTRSQLLLGNTILQWVFGLTGLLWGAIAEKRGTRLVLSIGSGFVAGACLLFGRMQTLWQLYAICFVLGAGLSAMGYLTNQMLQARWFARRRGLAVGLVSGYRHLRYPGHLITTALRHTSAWGAHCVCSSSGHGARGPCFILPADFGGDIRD